MELIRPKTLDEALGMMSAAPMTPLAGGTDVYPAFTNGAKLGKLIDISRIEDFQRSIRLDGDTWLISPHVTWSDVLAANLPPQFDGLKSCASEIGGRQIQNRATVIGNICNASPAADGVVAMLSLDARLRLASSRGERLISLDEFIRGNRSTLREPDELLVEIQIRDRRGTIGSAFTKLGARRYLVIS
ncbi:MAG: FAD binding domain-containing protein, partial [Planctomycetaceae bacterium]|nr:FAD binding domain-containing protein [Planctomycetaceae bacterium]